MALDALRLWNTPPCTPRLISNRENAVFQVIAPDGNRAALRLHRPGYQTDASIRSEMIWAQGLTDAGLNVPCPIPARGGDVIASTTRVASMVTWVQGEPLGAGGVAFSQSETEQAQLYHQLGAELARLHRASDAMTLPDNFVRPVLDLDGLLGDAPLWGRFWENQTLTHGETQLLLETRAQLTQTISNLRKPDFSLIHADALRENVLVQDGAVSLIDFDDGAFGYRLYDLGVAMSQNWALPSAADLADALADGYGLSETDAALIPTFTVMRVLASCGWAIKRHAPDDPVLRGYAGRAVQIAGRYLAGRPVFGA